MNKIVEWIEAFISIFKAGGENFVGMFMGIIPTLAILLVSINALIAFIGQERIDRFAAKGAKYTLFRYGVLPLIAGLTMPNPGGLTLGRFLKEEHKPAYGDSAAALGHPLTGLFPHANPAELFIWLGIASGIEQLGLATTELAFRYLIAGFLLALVRGTATERVYKFMYNRRKRAEEV